jgi:UDP-glucose 4-epimerase
MRIAVTGGAGFLGSHVADMLIGAGHDVTVVDAQAAVGYRHVVCDLADIDRLTDAFRGIDAVAHLAAVGDVYLAAEKPELAAHVNVTGTANTMVAALRAGVRRLAYASTWEVYGEPEYEPIDERHPCRPDHPYNITKLAGERIALSIGHLRDGISVSALRLGTAYGTRMRPNSVFVVFITKALARETITIQGTGEQGRQFTHARDIGRAFDLALTRAKAGAVYNAVSDQTVSIRELAAEITKVLPTEIAFAPARKADVPTAKISSELIRADLGWAPEVAFADGLAELVATYRRGD